MTQATPLAEQDLDPITFAVIKHGLDAINVVRPTRLRRPLAVRKTKCP